MLTASDGNPVARMKRDRTRITRSIVFLANTPRTIRPNSGVGLTGAGAVSSTHGNVSAFGASNTGTAVCLSGPVTLTAANLTAISSGQAVTVTSSIDNDPINNAAHSHVFLIQKM